MRQTLDTKQSTAVSSDSTKSIVGYTHYLIMKGQMAGNLVFDGHKATKEEKEISKKLQELSEQVSLRLSKCKESEIADLFECYDIAYRIGYQRLPDADFVSRQKNRLINAWKAKSGNVEESSVFGMIAGEAKFQTNGYSQDFTTVYNSILHNWNSQLRKHNTFPGISSYEKYQRLSMIMRENLDRYVDNAEKLKKQWYEFNKVDNISTLSSTILRSYRRFISSIPPSILPFDENMKMSNQILEELSSRTDLDPYDTEAFRIAFQCQTQLIYR